MDQLVDLREELDLADATAPALEIETEAEALAVVDSFRDRHIIGLLTEAYVLRRYAAALERRHRELIGDE